MSRSWPRRMLGTALACVVLFGGTSTASADARDDLQRGGACTERGTKGPDRLKGTPGDDVLCGLADNDILRGGRGHDSLLGGAGVDALMGVAGDDYLDGEAAGRRLDGGKEGDTCLNAVITISCELIDPPRVSAPARFTLPPAAHALSLPGPRSTDGLVRGARRAAIPVP